MSRIDYPAKHLVQIDAHGSDVHIYLPASLVQLALAPIKDRRLKKIQGVVRDEIIALVNEKRSENRPVAWSDISSIMRVDDVLS